MPLLHHTLVNATDLETWANRRDSQSTLPKVVRRLALAFGAGLSKVVFRADEGVQLPGWDGITVRDGEHPFVPAGATGWELSTRKDSKGKADEDYEARVKDPVGLVQKETTFVFATPRRWSEKQKWADARAAEETWRAVRVYDADDLATWLEQTPAVHVWISQLLGKQPEGATDLDTFWDDWTQGTRPAISADLILAGRKQAVEGIHQQLRSDTESFSVQAESREEALGVFVAAVRELPEPEREEILARSVIAHSRAALDYIAAAEPGLLIIPMFDDAEGVSRAVRRGHRVVLPLGISNAEDATVEVPRLAPDDAQAALVRGGIPKERADVLATLARRSLMALRRSLAYRPEIQRPTWARPETAHEIVPPFLAGSWNELNSGDLEVLGELARVEPHRIQGLAQRWARQSDPPLRNVGAVWYLVSKEDSWALLAPAITQADIERFESAALKVLGTIDSQFDAPVEDRWFRMDRAPYSSSLQSGLAETLATLGSRGQRVLIGGRPLSDWAARIIRTLLARANQDWRLWATLSHYLPLLAEAAPEEFLQATEEGLSGDQPLVKLFQDKEHSIFSSSPHTGLLWALERLAWSPDHLARTTLVLAKLARLDPGGSLGNRPRKSLQETYVLSYSQAAATWERQRTILRTVIEREPESGWNLCADLLPKGYGAFAVRTRPQWRDWAATYDPTITVGEHIRRGRELVTDMLAVVGSDGARWKDLISALPNLPGEIHETVVAQLENLDVTQLTGSGRRETWDALRDVIAHQRSYPDAGWALQEELIERLERIYNRLTPQDNFSRYGWLFSRHVELPQGNPRDWQAEERAVAKAREEAVTAIHRGAGTRAVEELVPRVEDPFALGYAFGVSGIGDTDDERIFRERLASEDRHAAQFGRGVITGRAVIRGETWLQAQARSEALSPVQRAEVLICLPSERRTWDMARNDPAVDAEYWKRVYPFFKDNPDDIEYAARRLVQAGRAFTAAQRLGYRLNDAVKPSATLIADVLEAALKQKEVDCPSGGLAHWIGELLDAIASAPDLDETRVAKIEWAFATALAHDRPLRMLHRELSRNPEFFVELLALQYRSENDEAKQTSKEERDQAHVAFRVMNSWKELPGTANRVPDPAALFNWVTRALDLARREGREVIGAQKIGEVLSHSPEGADGAWPHEAVRDIIDRLQNPELEKGVEIGRYNSRGVVSRGIMDGGVQERALADGYRASAERVTDRWPCTGAVLRRLEATYRREAQSEDLESELRKDGRW